MRLFILIAALAMAVAVPAAAKPKLAVVSYWGGRTENFLRIPDHSLALINPNSGILVTGSTDTPVDRLDVYNDVFRHARQHDIALYGYVPTGYFRHDCNQEGKCQTWDRIEGQVKTYFEKMPDLKGIFFDETAPADYSCGASARSLSYSAAKAPQL